MQLSLFLCNSVRFLYIELLKYYDDADNSIFEPSGDKLQIKSDISFHLYIRWAYHLPSHSPFHPIMCGVTSLIFVYFIFIYVLFCNFFFCFWSFKARHLVGTALYSISRAVRWGTTWGTTSHCLRTRSRANFAPKWRMVNGGCACAITVGKWKQARLNVALQLLCREVWKNLLSVIRTLQFQAFSAEELCSFSAFVLQLLLTTSLGEGSNITQTFFILWVVRYFESQCIFASI